MASHSLLQLESGTVTGINAAAVRTKLLQIASGAVYDGGQEQSYLLLDTERYELIASLIHECKHSVTFYNWEHQKIELAKALTKLRISFAMINGTVPIKKRNELIKQYQDGKYQTLLLHPATGAHGLTLTRGTRTIWCSPIDRADFLKQGLHRIYRGGQTEQTETLCICAENTLEQKVYANTDGKRDKMVSFLDILKEG